jgi:hypothetical protein
MRIEYTKGSGERRTPPSLSMGGMFGGYGDWSEPIYEFDRTPIEDSLFITLDDEEFALFAGSQQFIPLDRVRAALTSEEALRQALEEHYRGAGYPGSQGPFKITGFQFFGRTQCSKSEGARLDFENGSSLYVNDSTARLQFWRDLRPAVALLRAFPEDTPVSYRVQERNGFFADPANLPKTLKDVVADLDNPTDFFKLEIEKIVKKAGGSKFSE